MASHGPAQPDTTQYSIAQKPHSTSPPTQVALATLRNGIKGDSRDLGARLNTATIDKRQRKAGMSVSCTQ